VCLIRKRWNILSASMFHCAGNAAIGYRVLKSSSWLYLCFCKGKTINGKRGM
jgi:hypothetical protein